MIIRAFADLCRSTNPIPYDNTKCHIKRVSDEKGRRKVVTENPLKEELIAYLSADENDNHLTQYDIAKIEEGLVFLNIIEKNENAGLAIEVLKALYDNLGQEIKRYRTLDNDGWQKAIALLKGYLESNSNIDIKFPDKVEDRAKALLNLRDKYGLHVSVNDDGSLEICGVDKLFNLLDERVRNMGGRYFIESMLNSLPYSNTAERLILLKQSNTQDGFTKPLKMCPYNYILNIGLKNLSIGGNNSYKNNGYFNETIERFRQVCFAVMKVQSYSIWEDIFHKDKSPLDYLRDLIYRESVFDLHQSSMNFVVKFITHISKEGCEYDSKLPFPLSHFNKIINYIVHFFDRHKFIVISKSQLKLKKVPIHEIIEVLNFCSQPIAKFNENFCSPTDYDNVNFWFYPIAKIDDDKWMLLPKTIAARCLYEAFLNWIRVMDNSIDQKVGAYMESFLRRQFNMHNIKMLSGGYEMNDRSKGECDGLIESSKSILLLEMKKKPLVRASRKGDMAHILIDIADSLLASQVQNFRTSIAIKDGVLKLKNKNTESEIRHRGRTVERITITLFPFGDLQTRILTDQILRIFHTCKFVISANADAALSNEEKKEIKWLQNSYKKLEKRQKELDKYLQLINENKPFFNCWFLDIEKILYLLKGVNTVEQFTEHLLNMKYVSFGTYDFYNEDIYRKQIKL